MSIDPSRFTYFNDLSESAKREMLDTLNSKRPCGECYACCVGLGVLELKKWPMQACFKLDGQEPCARCTIYDSRPTACQTYNCGWRSGFGGQDARPDKSGLLVTIYPRERLGDDSSIPNMPVIAATIIIMDPGKAGTLVVGNLRAMVEQLLNEGIEDVRVVRYETQSVLHFLKGVVRQGKLLPSDREAGMYEALKFATYDPPIGRWEFREKGTL